MIRWMYTTENFAGTTRLIHCLRATVLSKRLRKTFAGGQRQQRVGIHATSLREMCTVR